MKLDDAQKKTVTGWIEAGLQLADIQKKLDSELGIKLTYMETRFLIDDLNLKFKEKEPATPVHIGSPAPSPAHTPAGMPEEAMEPESSAPAGGKVSVKVDQLARPGALASGEVTFSDGQQAKWQLDQMGRLGLVAPAPGYRPPEEDIPAFQLELQKEFAKLGL